GGGKGRAGEGASPEETYRGLARAARGLTELGELRAAARLLNACADLLQQAAPDHRSETRASVFCRVIGEEHHALPARLEFVGNPRDLSYVVGYRHDLAPQPCKHRQITSSCEIGTQQPHLAHL